MQKARHAIPLIDRVLMKVQLFVWPWIIRADELAEHTIERFRPYAVPKLKQMEALCKRYPTWLEKINHIKDLKKSTFEQVKDFKHTKGTHLRKFTHLNVVKDCGALRKYYQTWLEKIKEIKLFKATNSTQLRELMQPNVNKGLEVVRKYYLTWLERIKQIREFKDANVEHVKEFKEAQVAQLRESITSVVEPRAKSLVSIVRRSKYLQTVLAKLASVLEKAEALIDECLPNSIIEQKQRQYSQINIAVDPSYHDSYLSPCCIPTWFVLAIVVRMWMLFSFLRSITEILVVGT